MTSDILYIYKKEEDLKHLAMFKVLSHSNTLDLIKMHKDLIEKGFEHISTINSQVFIEFSLNEGNIKL